MSCNNVKPLEGFQNTTVSDVGAVVVSAVGVAMAIKDAAAALLGEDPMMLLITARVAELGAGVAVAAFIWALWATKCQNTAKGTRPCLAGIVDSLTPPATSITTVDPLTEIAEFTEKNTDIFPFMKEYPCFNLVVRCLYWPIIADHSGYIWYNGKSDPFITCYVKDPSLCQKIYGAAVGATIGGIGGIAAGWWADAAAMALCGASIFCAILAIIIGAIVAIICACTGAKIGFEVSGPATVHSGEPDSIAPAQQQIRVGDYVAVKGNMVQVSWLHNANALYFTEEWGWFGHENTHPPYTHDQANVFFESGGATPDLKSKEYWFCKLGIK